MSDCTECRSLDGEPGKCLRDGCLKCCFCGRELSSPAALFLSRGALFVAGYDDLVCSLCELPIPEGSKYYRRYEYTTPYRAHAACVRLIDTGGGLVVGAETFDRKLSNVSYVVPIREDGSTANRVREILTKPKEW